MVCRIVARFTTTGSATYRSFTACATAGSRSLWGALDDIDIVIGAAVHRGAVRGDAVWRDRMFRRPRRHDGDIRTRGRRRQATLCAALRALSRRVACMRPDRRRQALLRILAQAGAR